jgi:hypothetical protein
VIFIGCKLFNVGRENKKYCAADGCKRAPAHPQAMFVELSLITGKAPPDGQSDKKYPEKMQLEPRNTPKTRNDKALPSTAGSPSR